MSENIKDIWQNEAENWKSQGKDVRLFWAGKMSHMITVMANSNIWNMSANFALTNWVKDRYDEIIYSEMLNKK
jgi:hypothetical protein